MRNILAARFVGLLKGFSSMFLFIIFKAEGKK